MTRILIIGGIAAGMKAAATARRRKPDLDILVLQDEAEVSYSACGLPFSLGDPDAIPRAALIARSVERFRCDGIDLRVRHRVEEVDLCARRARVRSLGSDAISSEPFDRILFATGAKALPPKIPPAERAPPILPLRSMVDADRLRGQLRPGGRVVVIGGGYIGLEMAEALQRQGQAVTLVEAAPRLLPAFDPAIGEAVAKHLAGHGVTTHLGVSVAEAVPGGVMLADGRFVEADLALAAIGVRPHVELAAAAGVKLGETGAIAVDEAMRTNLDGVYAAGIAPRRATSSRERRFGILSATSPTARAASPD
jgi:NADPH-dependent 2,4-dienoyl-CoA reductase/sulfur reductase-like enzyme